MVYSGSSSFAQDLSPTEHILAYFVAAPAEILRYTESASRCAVIAIDSNVLYWKCKFFSLQTIHHHLRHFRQTATSHLFAPIET